MLPIPAPIIGSTSVNHTRLFIPLIYLGATASLCYLVLFAFIISNESKLLLNSNTLRKGANRDSKKLSENSGKRYNHSELLPGQDISSHQNKSSEYSRKDHFYFAKERKKREEKDEITQLSLGSPSTANKTQKSHFQRKTLTSLRKKTYKSKNGTRRSDPTKIWSGHQDLDKRQILLRENIGSKLSSEVYYLPWIKDEQCKAYKVQFAKNETFKPRALVSFPGSGNSWLRYMIECASGYFTGSVYDDKSLFTAGLLGELRPPNDGSTIVQKTHHDTIYNMSPRKRKAYLKLSELMFGYRGLLLIRNPYDALVSYWNLINTKYHTQIASQREFYSIRWIKFVTTQIPRWTSLIISWIENSQDYLIVIYEEVQKNPRAELTRILEYLGQPVDTGRLNCLMKPENLEGPFHRPHPNKKTSNIPLSVDLIPVTISQQHKTIQVKHQKEDSYHHHGHKDEQTLLLLDSKNSQQQHAQSPSVKEVKEQKEVEFLSPSPFQTISSTSSRQQNTNKTANSTSSSNDNHHNHQHQQNHHNNNHLNNSSILRLDLIIQDNIDKINRFFQQKSIPVRLPYFLRPNMKPYFLQTYTV